MTSILMLLNVEINGLSNGLVIGLNSPLLNTGSNISFRLYGVSRLSAESIAYPILNYSTELPVDYRIFKGNTSYCFKYDNNKFIT